MERFQWICDKCDLILPQPSRPAPGFSLPSNVKCPNGHGPMHLETVSPNPEEEAE